MDQTSIDETTKDTGEEKKADISEDKGMEKDESTFHEVTKDETEEEKKDSPSQE